MRLIKRILRKITAGQKAPADDPFSRIMEMD